jgi:hypothetical protein
MQPYLSSRTTKAALQSAALFATFLLFTPLSSSGSGITPTGFPFLTARLTYDDRVPFFAAAPVAPKRFHFFVDPQAVESFQFDIEFDETRASFLDIVYISPYGQTTLPDLSMLGSGLLQDVAGISASFPPPPGDVDIFVVNFLDLDPSLPPCDALFTVFASSNDFLVGVDPDTSDRTTYGSSAIRSLSISIPCPDSSSLMVDISVLGIIALGATYRRTKAPEFGSSVTER